MTNPTSSQRLEQFEGFLRQDPNNLALLAEAFDAAMQAGESSRAEFHLRHANALTASDPAWRLREAHWLLSQQRLDDADKLLHDLASDPAVPQAMQPVLAHDLAYLCLRKNNAIGGRSMLAPWVETVSSHEAIDTGTQVLWLRLLHRLGELERAMAWAGERWTHHQLPAPAAGVASLIALDANDFEACTTWSEFALQQFPQQTEALVARSSVALAQRDPASARRLVTIALRHNERDGRAWSVLGFANLLEQKLGEARDSFAKAVQYIPGHIGTWHGAGWTALLQQDLAAARRCFETALALDRNFAESHGGLAVVQVMQGQAADARESIDRALRLDRNNLSARYAQALSQGDIKDGESLRRLAERLLGGMPAPMGGTVLDVLASDA